jgi:hypothetical protein
MRPVPQRSAACALQQQRSRHALDVRDWFVLARLGDSSMRPAPQRSAASALQQQRSRHAFDVCDWLVLARLGEFSMRLDLSLCAAVAALAPRPRRARLVSASPSGDSTMQPAPRPVRCNSSARATASMCAFG